MKRLMLLFALLLAGCSPWEGVTTARPMTVINFDPINHKASFADSKDNDLSVESLTFNAQTKEFEVKNLKIVNNASAVRMANVAQISAYPAVIQAQGNAFSQGVGAVGSLVPFLGGKAFTTPQGEPNWDAIGKFQAYWQSAQKPPATTPSP